MAEQPSQARAGQHDTAPPTDSHSTASSPRTSTDSRSPHSRQPSLRLANVSSQSSSQPHRQSFSESLRNMPQSPRSRRQPSLTQAAIQGLIDNPPVRNPANPAFNGRDWRHISIAELVKPKDLQFVEADTGIEDATHVRFFSFLSYYIHF